MGAQCLNVTMADRTSIETLMLAKRLGLEMFRMARHEALSAKSKIEIFFRQFSAWEG
jgi:hypothetical protein